MTQKGRISLSHAQALASQAPLEMGNQVELEDLIERSRKGETERQRFDKLAAKPAAQARIAEENKKPWLERAVDVPLGKHRYQQREARRLAMEQQVSAYADKVRRNGSRKNAKQPMGPTPQRAAKATDGIVAETVIPGQGPVAPVKSHTIQGPLDRYQRHIPQDLEDAARDILHIFLLAETTPRITSNYNGASSAVYGPRHGGVADHVREAKAIVSAMEAELPKGVIDDVAWFIARIVFKSDGSEMKLADAGRKISPWKPDTDKDTAVGYGSFYRTLEVLARFLGRQRALGWSGPATANDARALLSEIRARAQIRREQVARRSGTGKKD